MKLTKRQLRKIMLQEMRRIVEQNDSPDLTLEMYEELVEEMGEKVVHASVGLQGMYGPQQGLSQLQIAKNVNNALNNPGRFISVFTNEAGQRIILTTDEVNPEVRFKGLQKQLDDAGDREISSLISGMPDFTIPISSIYEQQTEPNIIVVFPSTYLR